MKNYEAMMKGDFEKGAVSITIYTNLGDPVYAPKGKSVVKLDAYSNISAWPKDRTEYAKLKEQKVDELIALAARVIPELKDPKNIVVKEGYTPRTIERYTLNKGGVVYGFYLSPDQWQKVPIARRLKMYSSPATGRRRGTAWAPARSTAGGRRV